MKVGFTYSLVVWVLGLLIVTPPALAVDEELARPEEVRSTVALTYDAAADGTISGVLKNNGTTAARDVRLLIHHAWLWNDEKNPGPPSDNPARSSYYVVDGEIPPDGELRFRYTPSPPLPQRTDGRFRTSAEIVGVTEAVIPK
jgi:hypothetical protein